MNFLLIKFLDLLLSLFWCNSLYKYLSTDLEDSLSCLIKINKESKKFWRKQNTAKFFCSYFTPRSIIRSSYLKALGFFLTFYNLLFGGWCFGPFLDQLLVSHFLDTFQSCLNLTGFGKKFGFLHQDQLTKFIFCLGVETSLSSTLLKMFDTRIRKIKVSPLEEGKVIRAEQSKWLISVHLSEELKYYSFSYVCMSCIMVFCFQNCSDLPHCEKKIVLVI